MNSIRPGAAQGTPPGDASEPRAAAPDPASAIDGRDTKERLLDAAERLFAERGFEGASLRALTRAAGTSVSAAHYHFGGKEALLRAVLERRVAPLNRLRLAHLDALERDAGDRPPTVEEILDAWLRPVFAEHARERQTEARFIAARLYSDPPELVAALKRELFAELGSRYVAALARALPDRTPAEIAVAFQFVVGAMVHVMSGNLHDAPPLADEIDPALLAPDAVYARLHAFLAAGLRAPVPAPSGERAPGHASAGLPDSPRAAEPRT